MTMRNFGATMRCLAALALAAGLAPACSHDFPAITEPVPSWLAVLIRGFEGQPVADPPLYVARYEYQGQVVYYVPPRCCDIPSDLYDSSGRILCHPDGGFSGAGDGRCPNFFTQRTNEKIIWRDPRG